MFYNNILLSIRPVYLVVHVQPSDISINVYAACSNVRENQAT